MKKSLKIILITLSVIILLFVLDIGSIFLMKKPIFAVQNNDDSLDKVYYGLFYNTYKCWEYSTPQIKAKWNTFSCTRNIILGQITEIKDNYIVIKGLSDNNYLKTNQESHINLNNNPKIKNANNLIIGQYVKLIPTSIEETYPSIISTNEIEIIYANEIPY